MTPERNKGKILAGNKEEAVLDLIKCNFEREGYDVVTLRRGEGCLNKVLEMTPALMILELMLPGIDGLSVCRILKGDAKTSYMPIVMLSSKAE